MEGLLIIVTSYMSLRLIEVYQQKKKEKIINKLTLTDTVEVSVGKDLRINKFPENGEKKTNHNLIMSGSALGLGSLNSIPSLASPFTYYLGLFALGYSSLPMFRHTEKHVLKENRLSNETLNSLVILICITTGQYVAGSLVGMIYYAGDKVIARTRDHSKKTMLNVFDQQIDSAWVLRDGTEIEIPLEQIAVGDTVVVHTSEAIPVDGILLNGHALVDQQLLTGEAQVVEKSVGDKVMASTILVSGCAHIRVEKAGKETAVAKIQQILDRTSDYKSNAQLKGEKFADDASLKLLLFSLLHGPFMGLAGIGVILNSSKFGNRSRILITLGTLNYTALAAHRGILIKDGRALEGMADIDTVLFDKTGTLTDEQLEVGCVRTCSEDRDGFSESDVLYYAAVAEYKLNHPIAKAIVQEAVAQGMPLPSIDTSHYHVGFGICVEFEGKQIHVGSIRFIEMEEIEIPQSIHDAMSIAHHEGHSLVIVAVDRQVCGAVEIQTVSRPEVELVIASLRELGIKHLAIVSGDHGQPTRKLAESLKLDDFYASVLPDEKAEIVARLQAEGRKVCFIGDGVNDSIAMKKADVSVSLAGASTVATDAAQVILTNGNLVHFSEAFILAKKLKEHSYTSMTYTISVSALSVLAVYSVGLSMIGSILFSFLGYGIGIYHAMQPVRTINRENKHRLELLN